MIIVKLIMMLDLVDEVGEEFLAAGLAVGGGVVVLVAGRRITRDQLAGHRAEPAGQ